MELRLFEPLPIPTLEPKPEPKPISAAELAEIASALSNERKATVFILLLDKKLSADEISQKTAWPAHSITTILKQLHSVGLVSAERSSYYVYYQATAKARRLYGALS